MVYRDKAENTHILKEEMGGGDKYYKENKAR